MNPQICDWCGDLAELPERIIQTTQDSYSDYFICLDCLKDWKDTIDDYFVQEMRHAKAL